MTLVNNRLLAFYRGEGTDHRGRSLSDLWAMPPFWLEHTHDYIQWLFPIPEPGRFNGFAPLLGDVERAAFLNDELLRANQRHSLDVMLAFFGLARQERNIEPLSELNMRDHIWLKRGGHNHLRISRIIRSLYMCHQQELSEAFQKAVIDIGAQRGAVSRQTIGYWTDANKSL